MMRLLTSNSTLDGFSSASGEIGFLDGSRIDQGCIDHAWLLLGAVFEILITASSAGT